MKKLILPCLLLFCMAFSNQVEAVHYGYYGKVTGVRQVVGMPGCLIFDIAIFHDRGTRWDPTDDVLLITASVFSSGCDGIESGPTEPTTLNHHLVVDSTSESSGCTIVHFTIYDSATNDPVAHGDETVECSTEKRSFELGNQLRVINTEIESLLHIENTSSSSFESQVVSLSGQILHTQLIEPTSSLSINLTELSRGIYVLNIKQDAVLIKSTRIYKK